MARPEGMRVIRGRGARPEMAAEGVGPVLTPAGHPVGAAGYPTRRPVRDEYQPTPVVRHVGSFVSRVGSVVGAHPRSFFVLFATIVVVTMLYGPARDWYVARRSSEDLATYLAAVETQNDKLRGDLDRLQTQEGIELEARKRGFVGPNETSVLVENLPEDARELPDQITVEYETTWDSDFLDFVFGYQSGSWQ